MSDYTISLPVNQLHTNKIRALRYKRQAVSARLASEYTQHRVSHCMRSVTGNCYVDLKVSSTQHAFYGGLQTCGSVWDCPICSAKVSNFRGHEVRKASLNWAFQGGSAFMITFTMQHNKSDRLVDLARALTDAIRFVKSGSPWYRIKEQYGIQGSITGTEILYNRVNGWHYHKHMLVFCKLEEGADVSELEDWIYKRYESLLENYGYYSADGIGVKVSPVVSPKEAMDLYLAKWGLDDEITKVECKSGSGISPFELLDKEEDYYLFVEYSKAMHGKRRLSWSKGFREFIGLEEEKTDEEVSSLDDEEDFDVVWKIHSSDWKLICEREQRGLLLDIAERGQDTLINWVNEQGYHYLNMERIMDIGRAMGFKWVLNI